MAVEGFQSLPGGRRPRVHLHVVAAGEHLLAVGAKCNRADWHFGLRAGFLVGCHHSLELLAVLVRCIFADIGFLVDRICLGLGLGGEVEFIHGIFARCLELVVFALRRRGFLGGIIKRLFGGGLFRVQFIALGL